MSSELDFVHRAAFLRREEIGATVVSPKYRSENMNNQEVLIFDHTVIDGWVAPWEYAGTKRTGRYSSGQVLPRLSVVQYEHAKSTGAEVDSKIIRKMTSQEDERAEKILETLCEFCLNRAATSNQPLFQSPFHAEETERAFGGLRNLLLSRGLKAGDKELRRNLLSRQRLALVSNSLANKEAASVNDFVDELIHRRQDRRSLGFSTKVLQMDRFDELSLNLPSYPLTGRRLDSKINGNDEIEPLVETVTEVVASEILDQNWPRHKRMLWVIAKSLENQFERNIGSHARPKAKSPDFKTLAWLFLINLELVRVRRLDARVVFVTADYRLVLHAYSFTKDGLRRELVRRASSATQIGESPSNFVAELIELALPTDLPLPLQNSHPSMYFALNYVRHIWGYLAETISTLQIESDKLKTSAKDNEFKRRQAETVRGFRVGSNGWKGLFGSVFPDDRGLASYLLLEREAASSYGAKIKVGHETLEKAVKDFNDLLSDTLRSKEIIEVEKNRILHQSIIRVISEQKNFDWSELADRISEELALGKYRALVSLSEVGAQILSDAVRIGTRHPPNLSFESLPKTNSIFQKLYRKNGYEDHDEFVRDFDEISFDCWSSPEFDTDVFGDVDDRQELHLKFLVLGAAFASADRWEHALQSALRALDIIDRQNRFNKKIPVKSDRENYEGARSFMSGREANFLAAVARRVTAKGSKDLELDASTEFPTSASFLSKARECLKLDQRNGTARNQTDVRFDAEELALRLSQYYMDRFESWKEQKAGQHFSEDDCLGRYEEMRDCCNSLFSNILASAKVPDLTLLNAGVNIVQVCVATHYRVLHGMRLGEFENDPDREMGELLSYAVKACDDVLRDSPIVETMLISTYLDVGRLILDRGLQADNVFMEKLLENIAVASKRRVSVYDRWRYQQLEILVKHLVA